MRRSTLHDFAGRAPCGGRALKAPMVLVGLLFSAMIYPLTMILWHQDKPQYGDAMMLSLYVTLGILLLIAARNPSTNRSLIAFAAWSSFAHAADMAVMAFRDARERGVLPGVAIFVVIGVAFVLLAPARQSAGRASAASA